MLKAVCFYGGELWLWLCAFVYKMITRVKIMCWGSQSNGSWSLSNVARRYLTSWTWGPQPRSNRRRKKTNTHIRLHAPWQMQMGTYETWGIYVTDRAASTESAGCIRHWLTSFGNKRWSITSKSTRNINWNLLETYANRPQLATRDFWSFLKFTFTCGDDDTMWKRDG